MKTLAEKFIASITNNDLFDVQRCIDIPSFAEKEGAKIDYEDKEDFYGDATATFPDGSGFNCSYKNEIEWF